MAIWGFHRTALMSYLFSRASLRKVLASLTFSVPCNPTTASHFCLKFHFLTVICLVDKSTNLQVPTYTASTALLPVHSTAKVLACKKILKKYSNRHTYYIQGLACNSVPKTRFLGGSSAVSAPAAISFQLKRTKTSIYCAPPSSRTFWGLYGSGRELQLQLRVQYGTMRRLYVSHNGKGHAGPVQNGVLWKTSL